MVAIPREASRMNITMENLSSAPLLAPPLALSQAQLAFLSLHVSHRVEKWRWHWFETMLRATAGKRTATLGRGAAQELVDVGLMDWCGEGAWMQPTAAGRQRVQEGGK